MLVTIYLIHVSKGDFKVLNNFDSTCTLIGQLISLDESIYTVVTSRFFHAQFKSISNSELSQFFQSNFEKKKYYKGKKKSQILIQG